jgi:hypothetical protein
MGSVARSTTLRNPFVLGGGHELLRDFKPSTVLIIDGPGQELARWPEHGVFH